MEKRKVALSCSQCFALNYITPKSLSSAQRIEIKKFCPKCRTHTLHKEEK
ncbi:50S ribosomal protein L33 [Mycoplasmopsis columbina]|uniref:Large ribosomal subunit protein bL33 n=1 Tax=Mycoplasmopsis columbina SF7 TaxID=1037410 RepID=F9UJD5_9BACT|nr:50S ribosomal protein L33 [Mycoplasmopsis columbina]EGV00478.1 50S ribosomal protein L33 [Mycoplasmopsis columbina SF7]